MKKALCAVVLVMASTVVVAPTAHARQPCVSRSEAAHVHRGMPRARVHNIFDTPGSVRAKSGNVEVRAYRPCRSLRAVSVTYGSGRLLTKSVIRR